MTLLNAALAPAAPKASDSTTEAVLQENSGAIGGTNDGDLPDIGTVGGTYVQAEAVAVRDAVREVAQKINDLIDHMNDGR